MIDFEHSPLGGSGAKRWMNCGASFLLQRLLMQLNEYEDLPSSEYADKGNAAHELGAECLNTWAEPFEYMGEKIGDYVVHPADLDPDAVAVYVTYCQKIMEAGGSHGRTLIEQTIHLREVHPLFKGTVDFAHWRIDPPYGAHGLWLIDYKNGEGVGVTAFNNEQLLYYAVLLIMAHAELQTLPHTFPVHLGIVQPNYWGIFEEPEVWTTTLGHVLDFGHHKLMPTMKALLSDEREELAMEEFKPGDHCQFCPVMLDCPKLRQSFEIYAHADEFIDMLTDQELSDLYSIRDEARRYGKELEKVVYARKITGRDIPSAKLVEKMVHRVWKGGAEEAAKVRFGKNAYDPPKLKTPAKFEKLSSDGKAFALEWGFKPDSEKLTVAPLSDRRSEVKPVGNTEIFKNYATPLSDLTGW